MGYMGVITFNHSLVSFSPAASSTAPYSALLLSANGELPTANFHRPVLSLPPYFLTLLPSSPSSRPIDGTARAVLPIHRRKNQAFSRGCEPDGARNQASRSHSRNPGRKRQPGRGNVPPPRRSRRFWRRRVLPHRHERPRRRHQRFPLRQQGKARKENSPRRGSHDRKNDHSRCRRRRRLSPQGRSRSSRRRKSLEYFRPRNFPHARVYG